MIATLSVSTAAPSSVTFTDAASGGKLYPAAPAVKLMRERMSINESARADSRIAKPRASDALRIPSLPLDLIDLNNDKDRRVIFSPPCESVILSEIAPREDGGTEDEPLSPVRHKLYTIPSHSSTHK